MIRGFTLLEVVVALVLLEVGVVGAVGTLTIAARTLGQAERLERAVAAAEGILDSLGGVSNAEGGSGSYGGVDMEWSVDASGQLVLRASSLDPTVRFEVYAALPPR